MALKALFEYGMTASLFTLYYFTACLVLFVGFTRHVGQLSLIITSSLIALQLVAYFSGYLVMYHRRPEPYGTYTTAFKKNPFSQHYYYLVAAERVIIPTLIVTLNSFEFVGFLCAVIPITTIVLLAVKRPY